MTIVNRYALAALSTTAMLALSTADALAQDVAAPDAAVVEEQGGFEDIVVTAQRREERLQDVPVAVSAVSAEALANNRVTTVKDLAGLVPNMQVREQPGGSALPSYTMRGLINQGSVLGADKGVAVYIDGVFLGAVAGSLVDIVDLERVEVLRGPQGTLFGRNATGGAVSFITAEPKGEFGLKHSMSFGNYGQLRTVTRVNTPSFGPFSATASYTHSERRGDIKNLGGGTVWDFTPAFNGKPTFYTSPNSLGGSNFEGIGAAAKFEVDNFKAVYRFDWLKGTFTGTGFGLLYQAPFMQSLMDAQPNQDSLTPVGPKRPDAVNNWDTVPSFQKSYGHNLTMSFRASDAINLKSISAYRYQRNVAPMANITGYGGLINTGSAEFLRAICGSPTTSGGAVNPAFAPCQANVFTPSIGSPYLARLTTTSAQDKQWSQEIQATYDSDLLSVIVGGLYYRQEQQKAPAGIEAGIGRARGGGNAVLPDFIVPNPAQPALTGGRASEITIVSKAIFGQVEVHVTPEIDVIGGLRYTDDKKNGIDRSVYSTANPTTDILTYQDDRITYNLGVNFQPAPDKLIYAKYSTGFISGGSVAGYAFRPEIAKSWEVGLKADWFDRLLRTNVAAYSVKYTDIQGSLAGAFFTPPRLDIPQGLANIGDVRVKGVEVETLLNPADGVILGANLGYMDFKYLRVLAQSLAGSQGIVPAYRPKWTASFSGQYRSEPLFDDVSLFARVDANWRSKQYGSANIPNFNPAVGFDAAELEKWTEANTIKAYWLVNARIALEGFESPLGGKATFALWSRNLFNNRSPSTLQSFPVPGPSLTANFEPARTYGLDVSFEF